MPGGVTVKITDRAIINALNTPGGDIYQWRDKVCSEILDLARIDSPVNDPGNAQHRNEVVGTYKESWAPFDRRGSQGHHNIGRVFNTADHAIYVEYGRTASSKLQIFSWTEWGPGIYRVGGPTRRKLKGEGQTHLTKRQQTYNERATAFNKSLESLPERKGKKTDSRAGQYILTHAVASVLGGYGISF